jgi:hypothetical protein
MLDAANGVAAVAFSLNRRVHVSGADEAAIIEIGSKAVLCLR